MVSLFFIGLAYAGVVAGVVGLYTSSKNENKHLILAGMILTCIVAWAIIMICSYIFVMNSFEEATNSFYDFDNKGVVESIELLA
jgi:purine-cytosine permease-like protein